MPASLAANGCSHDQDVAAPDPVDVVIDDFARHVHSERHDLVARASERRPDALRRRPADGLAIDHQRCRPRANAYDDQLKGGALGRRRTSATSMRTWT